MVGIGVYELWLFGGNSNNGSNCGLAYANSNNAWSNSNANYSARHTIRKSDMREIDILSECDYCVMGKHSNTPNLGGRCVCIACAVKTTFTLRGVDQSTHPWR